MHFARYILLSDNFTSGIFSQPSDTFCELFVIG